MAIVFNLTFKDKSPLTTYKEKIYPARQLGLKHRSQKKMIKFTTDNYLRRVPYFHARSTVYSQGKKVLILAG